MSGMYCDHTRTYAYDAQIACGDETSSALADYDPEMTDRYDSMQAAYGEWMHFLDTSPHQACPHLQDSTTLDLAAFLSTLSSSGQKEATLALETLLPLASYSASFSWTDLTSSSSTSAAYPAESPSKASLDDADSNTKNDMIDPQHDQSSHGACSSAASRRSSNKSALSPSVDVSPSHLSLVSTAPSDHYGWSSALQLASAKRRLDRVTFFCPLPACHASFTRKFNLDGHLRSHSGTRPFECVEKDCTKSFARSYDLKRHEKLHGGVKAFRCENCSKIFARADALNRHMRSNPGRGRCVSRTFFLLEERDTSGSMKGSSASHSTSSSQVEKEDTSMVEGGSLDNVGARHRARDFKGILL
ncbi:hypothetical protein CBS101457_004896 [Exobasidium rhododendri]|nr:hypothetical protein CBS101457_004896 [Exobasidium rhododendri]